MSARTFPRLQNGAQRKFRTGGSGVGMITNARNPDLANVDILVKGAPDVLWWPFHAEWPRIKGDVINTDMGKMQRGEVPVAATFKDVNERLTRELPAS